MHDGTARYIITAHAKVTTREFLDYCDPQVRSLFRYWQGQAGDRALPRRQDIDPIDIPQHLPYLLLIDVQSSPLRFVYRLVGTEEVNTRGRDPTGQDVSTHFFGPSRDEVLACYHYVYEQVSFLFDRTAYLSSEGRPSQEETLFLPLSEDGRQVSQILVYAHPRREGLTPSAL